MPRHVTALLVAVSAVVLAALVVVVVAVGALHRRTDDADRRFRDIVLLSRFDAGRAADGKRLELQLLEQLCARRILALPPGGRLRHVEAASTADLVHATAARLEAGDRLFLGVLTSGDLAALKPLAVAFPDALFLSTASTASSLRLPDNIFRTANPDARSLPFLPQLLRRSFPTTRHWVVVVDGRSTWAVQIQAKLERVLSQSGADGIAAFASWDEVPTSVATAPGTGFVALTEADAAAFVALRAQPWVARLPPGTPLLFGDPSALSRTWQAASSPFRQDTAPFACFAFVSMQMLAGITVAETVLQPPVAPNLANLLLAGRVCLQAMWIARQLRAEGGDLRDVVTFVAFSRSVAHGTAMFDANGDRADIELGLVRWAADAAGRGSEQRWKVVATAGKHTALGDFDADLP